MADFYLPTTFIDPFGNASQVVYDAYRLHLIRVDGVEREMRGFGCVEQ